MLSAFNATPAKLPTSPLVAAEPGGPEQQKEARFHNITANNVRITPLL